MIISKNQLKGHYKVFRRILYIYRGLEKISIISYGQVFIFMGFLIFSISNPRRVVQNFQIRKFDCKTKWIEMKYNDVKCRRALKCIRIGTQFTTNQSDSRTTDCGSEFSCIFNAPFCGRKEAQHVNVLIWTAQSINLSTIK